MAKTSKTKKEPQATPETTPVVTPPENATSVEAPSNNGIKNLEDRIASDLEITTAIVNENNNLRTSIKAKDLHIKKLQSQITKQGNDLAEALTDVKKLENATDALRRKIDALSEERQEINKELDAKTTIIINTKAKLQDKETRLKAARIQIETYAKEMARLQAEVNRLRSRTLWQRIMNK